jgi:hypothetical protein
MSSPPELVQFGDLTPTHFSRHPVWIQCHGTDSEEPWHDATNEETFRPWLNDLPVDPSEGMLLVAATFTLADGSSCDGFVTPAMDSGRNDASVLGTMQPHMFLPTGRQQAFWQGMFPRAADRQQLYDDLGRTDGIFPIAFKVRPGLTTGLDRGQIDGFYTTKGLRGPVDHGFAS